MIDLTEEERRKFAAYCAQEALSYRELVEQAMKLPGGSALAAPLVQQRNAYAIVCRHLEKAERVILNGASTIGVKEALKETSNEME